MRRAVTSKMWIIYHLLVHRSNHFPYNHAFVLCWTSKHLTNYGWYIAPHPAPGLTTMIFVWDLVCKELIVWITSRKTILPRTSWWMIITLNVVYNLLSQWCQTRAFTCSEVSYNCDRMLKKIHHVFPLFRMFFTIERRCRPLDYCHMSFLIQFARRLVWHGVFICKEMPLQPTHRCM